MSITTKNINKVKRAYKKRFKILLDSQLDSKHGFLAYIITYLTYIRDQRILRLDLRKQVKEATPDNQTGFDELTLKLSNALLEFALYEEAATKYKILTNVQNEKEQEAQQNAEKAKLLQDLTADCLKHWAAFWNFIELNIASLEDWANV